jgi:hypothetical protein
VQASRARRKHDRPRSKTAGGWSGIQACVHGLAHLRDGSRARRTRASQPCSGACGAPSAAAGTRQSARARYGRRRGGTCDAYHPRQSPASGARIKPASSMPSRRWRQPSSWSWETGALEAPGERLLVARAFDDEAQGAQLTGERIGHRSFVRSPSSPGRSPRPEQSNEEHCTP